MSEIYYLNGKMVHREEAKISVLDYGFLYGYGLYETIRAYNGKLFRLDDHLARLRFSGERLGIYVNAAEVRQAVLDTVQANSFTQARVRITMSAGAGSMNPNLASCTEPTLAVLAAEYKPFSHGQYVRGFKVIITSMRRNSRSPVTGLKSANTIENMLARREAHSAGADEVLFFNEKDCLAESAGSNVFIASDGILKTPRLENGILPGVTRVIVFQLAAQLGIKVQERNLKIDDLLRADEVFLTNSLIEIMPVTEVAGKRINNGKPGNVTKRLAKAYKEMVAKETA